MNMIQIKEKITELYKKQKSMIQKETKISE